jgi:hypothetical protein
MIDNALLLRGYTMRTENESRLVFGDFVDKVFWAVISGFLFWIAMSITSLNEKIAVIVTQIEFQNKINDDHGRRIETLEREVHGK